MNRTDRLLAIMLELQARRYTRAEDLAAQFEVSVRTIYRDVLALCEAGVPVVATPGYGYALAPGYFLPPLMLTSAEAGMLLLGSAFVADRIGPPYKQAVAMARKKVEKILPEGTLREVEFLQDAFRFTGRVAPTPSDTDAHLAVLQRAVVEREVLHLRYHARYGEPGERDVEPYVLVHVDDTWLLGAYCRVRQDMRHFRLDRVDAVTPTGEHFERRQSFVRREMPPMQHGDEEVTVFVAAAAVRWVREGRHYSFIREDPHLDGVLMIFRPRDPRELLPWLLSWGQSVQVLAPPTVRQAVHAAATAIAALYKEH
jgi:predicted DNA-binding transcriptional regulator YafY